MTGYAGPDGSATVVRPGPAGNRIALHHRPGRPGAVPLVLCSGIGAPQQVLTPFVDHLDPARPVIGVDPPGIGEAPPVRRPYRLPLLAGAVRAAVHHLGYRRFDVLGVSWGGGLAQQLAFGSPRRCRRQVLVATGTGCLMVPAGPCTLARMLTPRRHQDPRYAAEIVGELYGGSARTDPAGVLSALHPGPSATSRGGYLAQLGALAGWSSLPFLPLVRPPTLVLAGDDDPLIPAVNATVLGALLPHARVHRYRGGHLHLLSHPHELAPVVDRFLDDPDDLGRTSPEETPA